MAFALANRVSASAVSKCAYACTCARCSTSFGIAPRGARPEARRTVSVSASASSDKKNKLTRLLSNNKQWAAQQVKTDPKFFLRLKDQQSPEYLWIGCADSRVPANQIVGLDPGEVFVQRNVGNQAHHTDMNCQSCIEFSVKALGVRTIIVCGHYKCGAVKAALTLPSKTAGLTNCWIADIREARNQHVADLKGLSEEKQVEKLCEYNVLRQVFHVCTSPTVQEMWDQGVEIQVFGVCYSLEDGILKPLVGPITSNEKLGTSEQVEFVNDAMANRDRSLLENLMGMVAGKSFEEKVTVPAASPRKMSPEEMISGRLAEHAAWDQGKN